MHELDRVAPWLVAFLAVSVASSCLVDADAPCGPARVLGADHSCLCPGGQVEAANGRDCVAALTATDAGMVASATVADAGLHEEDATILLSGPTGLGVSCATSADCTAFDATYCETFQSHVCLIEGCSSAPDDCPSGWSCCDLSSFGMPALCVTSGSCPL